MIDPLRIRNTHRPVLGRPRPDGRLHAALGHYAIWNRVSLEFAFRALHADLADLPSAERPAVCVPGINRLHLTVSALAVVVVSILSEGRFGVEPGWRLGRETLGCRVPSLSSGTRDNQAGSFGSDGMRARRRGSVKRLPGESRADASG